MKITDLKTGKQLGYEDCFCLRPSNQTWKNESKFKLFLRRNWVQIGLFILGLGIGFVLYATGYYRAV